MGLAHPAFSLLEGLGGAKYPKAAACLVEDREALLAFFAYPAEHWLHLRTTNLIESPMVCRRRAPSAASSSRATVSRSRSAAFLPRHGTVYRGTASSIASSRRFSSLPRG